MESRIVQLLKCLDCRFFLFCFFFSAFTLRRGMVDLSLYVPFSSTHQSSAWCIFRYGFAFPFPSLVTCSEYCLSTEGDKSCLWSARLSAGSQFWVADYSLIHYGCLSLSPILGSSAGKYSIDGILFTSPKFLEYQTIIKKHAATARESLWICQEKEKIREPDSHLKTQGEKKGRQKGKNKYETDWPCDT